MNFSTNPPRSLRLSVPTLVIALIVAEGAMSQDTPVLPPTANDPTGSPLASDQLVPSPDAVEPTPAVPQPTVDDNGSPENAPTRQYPRNQAIAPTNPPAIPPGGTQPVPAYNDPDSDFQLLQPYRDAPNPGQPVPRQAPGSPTIPNAVPQYQAAPPIYRPNQQQAPQQASELRICYLKFADAEACAAVLRELFQQQGVTITSDARINAIIVRAPATAGNRSPLKEIEEVLAQLDKERPAQPAAAVVNPSFPGSSPLDPFGQSFDSPTTDSPAASRHAREAEAKANEIAQALRGPLPNPLSPSQLDQRREELRAAVAEAFEARQRMHQAQLNLLRHRLARVEQQVSARETLKDRIIDRRTDELLDPNLDWETGLDLGKAPRAVRPVPAVGLSGTAPRVGAVTPGAPVPGTAPSQAEQYQANEPPIGSPQAPLATNGSFQPEPANTPNQPAVRFSTETGIAIPSPSEFIEAVRGIEKEIADSQRWPESRSQLQRNRMEAARDRHYAQLATIRREYQTITDSLSSQLAASEAGLVASENDLRRMERLTIAGAISSSEIEQARVAVAKARAQVEQLKAILSLYQSSEAAIFGNVADDALSQLEGKWQVVTQSSGDDESDIPNGRLVIAGNRLTLYVDGKAAEVADIAVDGVNHWIDLEVNPDSDSPNHTRGIYRLEADRLRLVIGESGKRPAGFSEIGKTGIRYWELKRLESESDPFAGGVDRSDSPDDGGALGGLNPDDDAAIGN